MVQQPTSGPEQVVERLEVRPHPLVADVLGHADRRDRVERSVTNGSVVLDADLHPIAEPEVGDPAACVRRLLVADRHTDHVDVVMRGGVDRHRPPPASDVQHPWPRPPARLSERLVVQAEFAADQLLLGGLRLLEGRRGVDEAGARVRHRRAEDHLVEGVADVVVMADRLLVATDRVPDPVRDDLLRRGGRRPGHQAERLRRRDRRGYRRDGTNAPGPQCRRGDAQHVGEIAGGVEITGDEGPGEAEFTRCPDESAKGIRDHAR